MHRLLAAAVALLCCTPVAAQALNAEVDRIGPRDYRIRITFPGVVSPTQAQSMLAEVGAHLCGGQAPAWGHYTFETNEPVDGAKDAQASTKFEQELACGDGVATAKPGTPAPRTPATEEDRRDLEARTLDYLSKKDHDEFAAADALFADDVIAQFDRARWRDPRRAFNREAGLPEARTVVGVTFYDDPVDAPSLGRHAAVDYRATYSNRAFYCGYVVWLRQGDGSYRLIREEESLGPDALVRRMTDEQVAALKQQPGCRDPQASN